MRRKVDEDLERIREANMPPPSEGGGPAPPPQQAPDPAVTIVPKTAISMILALYSLALPYIGGFALFLLAFWLVVRLISLAAGP